MNILMTWVNSAFSFLAILATLAGLVVAGIVLPEVIAWIRSDFFRALLARPLARLILWISLGALFSNPLIDLLRWIGNLVETLIVSPTPYPTLLGLVSIQAILAVSMVLFVLAYGGIFWIARGFLESDVQPNRLGRFFILASVASLVYRGIVGIFNDIFAINFPASPQLNYGALGFTLEVLVGLLLLFIVIAGANIYLPGHPLNDQKQPGSEG